MEKCLMMQQSSGQQDLYNFGIVLMEVVPPQYKDNMFCQEQYFGMH